MAIGKLRANQLWSIALVVSGIGFLFGYFDLAFHLLVKTQMSVDIRHYETPHYDRFVAQEPLLGAILLVGGLILWFMPTRHG